MPMRSSALGQRPGGDPGHGLAGAVLVGAAAAGQGEPAPGDLAFLEATLADSAGAVIATATATARVISIDQARSAA